MHNGCADAKARESNPKPRKSKNKAHTAAARSNWSSGGEYYNQALADFRRRMLAKYGVRI